MMKETTDDIESILDDSETELENRKWKNRRDLAFRAFYSLVSLMIVLLTPLVTETRITALNDPITWFFISMSSIIGMYFGATTWANFKK